MKKILKEFAASSPLNPASVVNHLRKQVGTMERLGGSKRIYLVGDSQGAVYTFGTRGEGLGISWKEGKAQSVYYWSKLNLDHEPDYEIDLPEGFLSEDDGEKIVDEVVSTVLDMIRNKTMGKVEV